MGHPVHLLFSSNIAARMLTLDCDMLLHLYVIQEDRLGSSCGLCGPAWNIQAHQCRMHRDAGLRTYGLQAFLSRGLVVSGVWRRQVTSAQGDCSGLLGSCSVRLPCCVRLVRVPHAKASAAEEAFEVALETLALKKKATLFF